VAVVIAAGWAIWSFRTGGIVATLFSTADDPGGSLDVLRAYFDRAGMFGPVLYVIAVVLEVIIAPIPGTLLYAPAGAIFGGLMGGSLSLGGNVTGAMVATFLANVFGHRLTESLERSQVRLYADRIRDNSILVIALLRVNPLTSSDLVSYAAGLAGIPPWRVGLGTFIGMAPLCFLQAYAAETLFKILPASGLFLLGLGVVYAALVFGVLVTIVRARRRQSGSPDDAP
jgi:uncharacterized membrane protein YdjX (TVP38/TMEM64 family)